MFLRACTHPYSLSYLILAYFQCLFFSFYHQVQSNGESLDVLAGATPGSTKPVSVSHTFVYDKAFHPREGQVCEKRKEMMMDFHLILCSMFF